MTWLMFELWLIGLVFILGILVVGPARRFWDELKQRTFAALSRDVVETQIVERPVYIDRPVLADEPMLLARLILDRLPHLETEEKEELLAVIERRDVETTKHVTEVERKKK